MRRTMRAGVLVAALMVGVGCTTVAPDAGQEAVLVMKPVLFGQGGVDSTPVPTGLQYVAFTTWPVYVDMRPTQVDVVIDDAMSADNVPLDFSAAIRVQVRDSVRLIEHFGPDWFANNVGREFDNRIRTAIKRYRLNDVAGSPEVAAAIDLEVSTEMTDYMKAAGIPVDIIGVAVGRANPPDSIRTQREATAAQQQRLETERQTLIAEQVRENAEAQRAKSDNAYREGMRLSPEQFVELEKLKAFTSACGDGKCTILMGTGANALLTLK
jgi:regulator of protease activity HflC (stomatin/prohibitin superfamily)